MANNRKKKSGERPKKVTHQTSDGKDHSYPDQALRHIKKHKLEDKTVTRKEE